MGDLALVLRLWAPILFQLKVEGLYLAILLPVIIGMEVTALGWKEEDMEESMVLL
jgi:hypothetical protein